jgi:hypothetical protein
MSNTSDITIPPTIMPTTELLYTRLDADGEPETLWLTIRVRPGSAPDATADDQMNDRGEIFLELTSGNETLADRYVGWRVTENGLDLWLDPQGSRKPRARKTAA